MTTPHNATTPIADTPVVVAPTPVVGERPGFHARTKMCRKWCTTTNTWVDM